MELSNNLITQSLTSSTMEFKKTSAEGKFKIQEFHLSNAVPIDLQCRFIAFSNLRIWERFLVMWYFIKIIQYNFTIIVTTSSMSGFTD